MIIRTELNALSVCIISIRIGTQTNSGYNCSNLGSPNYVGDCHDYQPSFIETALRNKISDNRSHFRTDQNFPFINRSTINKSNNELLQQSTFVSRSLTAVA